jgi:aminomethyltransferase
MSQPTPFLELHKSLGGRLADYGEWKLPADYGDMDAELAALHSGSAAFDLSGFGRIAIAGAESPRLIDRLLAGSTAGLVRGRWIWSLICNQAGSLVDIVRAARLSNSYLLLTSPGRSQVIVQLAAEAASDFPAGSVSIQDQTHLTGMLGIYGPAAFQATGGILPLDTDALEPGTATQISILVATVTVLRGGWLGLDGVELIGASAACKLAAGAIERYHKRRHITPAGIECLEVALTEASLPIVVTGQPLPERRGPLSYGLGRLIDSGKDFLGKKALAADAAAGPQRCLTGLKAEGKVHTHKGLTVQYDGLEIGWTDRLVWSDALGSALALAMVDSEMHSLAEAVQVVGPGFQAQGELVALPFDRRFAAGIWVD